jgi:anti-sigma factor ChrR (cupin superfamily)
MRNPPGSGHAPSSRDGALLFVKLRQMPAQERRSVRIDTRDPAAWQQREGRATCLLFASEYEHACLHRLAAHEAVNDGAAGGMELLVLAGALALDGQPLGEGSWIRLPDGDAADIAAGDQGATVYVKTGHLGCVPGATGR